MPGADDKPIVNAIRCDGVVEVTDNERYLVLNKEGNSLLCIPHYRVMEYYTHNTDLGKDEMDTKKGAAKDGNC